MPAIPEEIEAAEHEGVKLVYLAAPHRIVGDPNGQVRAIEVVRTRLGRVRHVGPPASRCRPTRSSASSATP